MDRFELLIYSVFGVLCALGVTAAIGYEIAAYLDKQHDNSGPPRTQLTINWTKCSIRSRSSMCIVKEETA
ncbi:hypothetical protein C1S65_22735 [Pseudomonas putida]|uniref:Uncharacterized protein n=1 Tax=Pseudomonas putida TaxID=303 RepID=A0AAD0PGD2_PSEPU|nr:hypothetical protein C1S65_22735 [Pseudomonas putida]